MRREDISREAVERALCDMRVQFRTKDVSNHEAMEKAHPWFYANDKFYHRAVGSYLSHYRGDLQIKCKDSHNNATWEKTGAGYDEERSLHPIGSPTSDSVSPDIGPQYLEDKPLQARMRFHQSWYRAFVLGVPCGTGPSTHSATQYGSMLRRCDGEKGLNFLTPEVFHVAKQRMIEQQGAVEPFRALNNMLSSQPMCFNLFGSLVSDKEAATRALQALLGTDEVALVTRMIFEYAPAPRNEHLNDRTAFDVFVEYVRTDGDLGFVGIETKLTDTFSKKAYDTPVYRKWTEMPDSPWPMSAWSRVADVEHNQLWRDHMLMLAHLHHPKHSYSSGRFMLAYHSQDSDCTSVVDRYRSLLKPEDASFMDFTLDTIVSSWEQALPDRCRRWLAAFRLRYLDLAASEAEWLGR